MRCPKIFKNNLYKLVSTISALLMAAIYYAVNGDATAATVAGEFGLGQSAAQFATFAFTLLIGLTAAFGPAAIAKGGELIHRRRKTGKWSNDKKMKWKCKKCKPCCNQRFSSESVGGLIGLGSTAASLATIFATETGKAAFEGLTDALVKNCGNDTPPTDAMMTAGKVLSAAGLGIAAGFFAEGVLSTGTEDQHPLTPVRLSPSINGEAPAETAPLVEGGRPTIPLAPAAV